jgi:hypothetical protein
MYMVVINYIELLCKHFSPLNFLYDGALQIRSNYVDYEFNFRAQIMKYFNISNMNFSQFNWILVSTRTLTSSFSNN